ncbi:hypothetical protein GCM10023144_18400 [Pigmentiphaga soli]|uniref:O-antigen ligase-related domain-containing protein n=1 Tax=Pigmentiphaga soli TaxID=1007095 RepID=A0ABP8GVJ1_9BURK
MNTSRSTLPLLCLFVFCALALNDDTLVLQLGGFKVATYDLLFIAMVLVKFFRLGQPGAYALPSGGVGLAMGLQCVALAYLALASRPQPDIVAADTARDLRIVLYFVSVPFLCYKDIDGPAAYAALQRTIVLSGVAVATLMLGEQLGGFSISQPLRDVRLGVWALPFAMVSIILFPRTLRLGRIAGYALTLYLLLALVMSLNRSQYLQLAVSVALAALLGMRAGALRKSLLLYAPALLAGILVFQSIGYMDVLLDRVFSVQDLSQDSSYGARIEEMEGQMDLFREAPLFGHGAGMRSWVMGEEGFELSTFAHNSWAFYLMKFGMVGLALIMLTPLSILLLALARPCAHPALELHRRYLLSCLPVYIVVDSFSGGLSYAPKTAFLGFLLCYCLALMNHARLQAPAAPRAAVPARPALRGMATHG